MAGPPSNPQSSGAMVAAQIVLAGAASTDIDAECAAIKASFDPPIVTGSHSSVAAANKASGSGCQAEHAVPASNFHESGRSGPRIEGASGYNTGDAFCWNAFDNQSAATEHKVLTDAMKQFSESLGGQNATLEQWMDQYQKKAEECLASESESRSDKAEQRSRLPGKTKEEREALAKKAAACLRIEMERAFAAMDPPVSPSTPLRNGLTQGPPPPSAPAGGSGVPSVGV